MTRLARQPRLIGRLLARLQRKAIGSGLIKQVLDGRDGRQTGSGRLGPLAWDKESPRCALKLKRKTAYSYPPSPHCHGVTAICIHCENGKSISRLFAHSGAARQVSRMEHRAKTNLDLARPSGESAATTIHPRGQAVACKPG